MTFVGERVESVLALLRAAADLAPDAAAVTLADTTLSHGAMWRDAGAIAGHLRSLEVAADDVVAIVLDRDIRWASAILAVMSSGTAFLPIDASLPEERIRYQLTDSRARHVLTSRTVAARLAHVFPVGHIALEDVRPAPFADGAWQVPAADPRAAAYVIYTSGSTGAPKGVVIEHGSLAFSLQARLAFYAETTDCTPPRVLSGYGFSVDSVLAGFFWALASGGNIIMPAAGQDRDAVALSALMLATQPTHIDFVPGMYALLLEMSPAAAFQSLHCVTVGGEALARGVVQQHLAALPHVPLVNEYGPTECTIWASAKRYLGTMPDGEDVSIGAPLPGTTFLVTDGTGSPVPDGDAGDLWITGPHLARGYLHDAARTAQRFRTLRGADGQPVRAYHTGDRVRGMPGGEFMHLGRSDHQVKLSGYRVELGEVEFALAGMPQVQQAAVVLHGSGPSGRLVAYAVLHAGARLTASEMRRTLKRSLPDYMIPAVLLVVDAMPLTVTGKVDRMALPSPFGRPAASGSEADQPTDPVEQALAEVWAMVLNRASVRRTDNFFELGGTSLMAVRAAAELQRRHGYTGDVGDMFHRSLKEIAADLREGGG